MENTEYFENLSEPSQVDNSRVGPRKAVKRKLRHHWVGAEESALIAAVQKRPCLYDSGDAGYKLTNVKNGHWNMVAAEIDIENVDMAEARNKWNSMRSNFKAVLGKVRSRKSRQGTAETESVTWPHFKEMLFVESTDVANSTTSTSTLDLENATSDKSLLDDLSQSFDMSTPQLSSNVGERRSRTTSERSRSTTKSPSPDLRAVALEALSAIKARTLTVRSADHYSAYGEVVAGHLRSLPREQALELECILSRALYGFLEKTRISDSYNTDR